MEIVGTSVNRKGPLVIKDWYKKSTVSARTLQGGLSHTEQHQGPKNTFKHTSNVVQTMPSPKFLMVTIAPMDFSADD